MGDLNARVCILCGLEAEAAALGSLRGHPRIDVVVSGANAERGARLLHDATMPGATVLLVSWGISGGIDPALTCGDLVEAHLLASEPRGQGTGVHGVDRIVGTTPEKSRLYRETGAQAVDMESHVVAATARQHGIPWIAIRAISDDIDTALPDQMSDLVDPRGRPMILRAVFRLIRRPGLLTAFLKARKDSNRALATLSTDGVDVLKRHAVRSGIPL